MGQPWDGPLQQFPLSEDLNRLGFDLVGFLRSNGLDIARNDFAIHARRLALLAVDRQGLLRAIQVVQGEGPADAFRLEDVKGVAVVTELAKGRKSARSWKVTPEVGRDPDYPDVTPRDAAALREWDRLKAAAE